MDNYKIIKNIFIIQCKNNKPVHVTTYVMIGSISIVLQRDIYIYIYRIDSLQGSLTPSARSDTLQLHALTNNTFANFTNHDISRLYTSTSGYMLFRYLNLGVGI